MKLGQFSAFVNVGTGIVTLVKSPNEYEYQNNSSFSSLVNKVPRKIALDEIQQFFEDNYVPEEQRIILN